MASIFIQIAAAVAGLAIFIGLYFGNYPGIGLRGGIIAIAIVIVAAFILHFVRP
jgi:hypothetical protein